MNLIARIGVGKISEKITIRTFEGFIGTFLCLVSNTLISKHVRKFIYSHKILQIEENCKNFLKTRSFLNRWANVWAFLFLFLKREHARNMINTLEFTGTNKH